MLELGVGAFDIRGPSCFSCLILPPTTLLRWPQAYLVLDGIPTAHNAILPEAVTTYKDLKP